MSAPKFEQNQELWFLSRHTFKICKGKVTNIVQDGSCNHYEINEDYICPESHFFTSKQELLENLEK